MNIGMTCCEMGERSHPAVFRIDELDAGTMVAGSDTYACEAHLAGLIGSGGGRVTTRWLVTYLGASAGHDARGE
jgi:hypothetical protein